MRLKPPVEGDVADRCAYALGSSLDPAEALGALANELRPAVAFDGAELGVDEDGEEVVLAAEGRGDGDRLGAALVADGHRIGTLTLLRAGGFQTAERELVVRVAARAGPAARHLRDHAAALREADELRRRATRRAQFVALVAHDLRTPLAAVIGSVQTLRQRAGDLSPDQHDSLLEVIANESDRLAGLVGEVFDSSRIDADSFSYSFAAVEVGALVEEAVAAAAVAQQVEVMSQIADALPLVRGDRARLRQVLSNLIDNAVKYSPGSPVEVLAEMANGRVVVSVTDHGDGIAPDDQARVFEQFGRVAGTGKPGTGLGLYISRVIAEAHDGTLGLTSAPGEGATFTLSLPPA